MYVDFALCCHYCVPLCITLRRLCILLFYLKIAESLHIAITSESTSIISVWDILLNRGVFSIEHTDKSAFTTVTKGLFKRWHCPMRGNTSRVEACKEKHSIAYLLMWYVQPPLGHVRVYTRTRHWPCRQ